MSPVGDTEIELPHVPAMSRRRLGQLAKLAISVADQVLLHARGADIPVVWASRYGDAEKTLALLRSQALDEPLSPTAFGLSVHNAVGAQHSILRGMRANSVCVASSHCVPEAGVVEAVGLLSDMEQESPEVLLVCYDGRLPHDYAVFHDEPASEYAWAALLAPCPAGSEGFVLQAQDCAPQGVDPAAGASALPHGLDVLHFLVQAQRHSLMRGHASGQWMWERVHV
ncbi:beta-ketoacyl synthase-like protein [Acidovorax sp. 69]|nr:beta-ketoacyl synthase-like protein [Acidovorax sp. 69]